jgi:hypothetical protein
MNKRLLLTALLLLSVQLAFTKHIEEEDAKRIGHAFLKANTLLQITSTDLETVYKEKPNGSIINTEINQVVFFYVFNVDTEGFVIVSGDDSVYPILGYSNEGRFHPHNIPQNVAKWLEEYKNQIRYVIDNNISATQEIQNEWAKLAEGSNQNQGEDRDVAPLLQTQWNQSPFVNALCPSGTVTGCVATAMAQIMKYWNYPSTGSGFHSYNHQVYGTLSANFGSTTYQWGSMPNIVNNSNSAVATLMFHVGVSVDMNYGPSSTGGSGAYVISSQSPVQHCSEYALKTYFGYKPTLQGVQRSSYNQTQWINLLKNELDNSRPVLYAGFGSGGGHAFVCDGYDNNNFFHFNWGWGGSSDGYFQINALNPGSLGAGGGTGGYNNGHQAVIGIEPPAGVTPQNHDLRLYSDITMPSTYIWFTNPINLTVNIANYGTGSFTGQYGAAVFDHNFNFVDFVEVKSNMALNSNSYHTNPLTFSNAGSPAFVPGIYYVALYYKTTTQNWTIIGDGNYTNLKQFEIYYSASIETNSAFNITTNGGQLIQGQPATVNVDVLNTANNTFYGQYRISLSNLNGTLAQSIQTLNENTGLPYNYHYPNGLSFTGSISVAPGTYLMEIAFKAQGSSSWYYAGSSNYSNPIYVIVTAPALSPDQYEANNTVGQAYTLPISFSGNTATKNTTGSNLHIGTDYDYYKINLPSGYNYTITARLHDAYNSSNGNTYSVDALFSHSTNGSTWSDAYDDIMSGNITVQNGGTVYFHVAPYFAGETGTYLLDMTINRTATVGVEDIAAPDLIKLFPNPANDFATVDLAQYSGQVNSVSIYNFQGQQVLAPQIVYGKTSIQLPLHMLSDGIYFVQIHSSNGVLTKKIIVRK